MYLRSMKSKKFSWKSRGRSFKYAFSGIVRLVGSEHNMWLHLSAAVIAIAFGFALSISAMEWIAIIACIGAVFSAEAFNTAIEYLADRISSNYDEAVGRAKDVAAGAVLFLAVASAVVGAIIFIPKIIVLL